MNGLSSTPKRIAIFVPNWIGDVVMSTPTLRAIRNRFGGSAEIIGVMKPYVSNVLAGTSFLDDHIEYDRKSANKTRRSSAVIAELRKRDIDTIVLLTNSLRAGYMAWRSGAANRIGYARYGRSLFLSKRLHPRRSQGKLTPTPAIEYYLELAYAIGCPQESPQMELATLPADELGAEQAWGELGLNELKDVIVFNTGGAYGAAKHWPTENYIELAKRIVSQHPDRGVLVICGPSELESARAIETAVNHPRVRSMADQDLSLGVAKACVRKADLMVTTDSGPRHFAPAFNVPVISLFGPIDPRWSDSLHPQAINLTHNVDCRPCGKRQCPLKHHQCMRGISVQQVYQTILKQLDSSDRAAA